MWLGLEALVRLILSDNKITIIHDKTFSALPRITHLFLDENLLTTFSNDFFDPRTNIGIPDIFRGRSNLSCSCTFCFISVDIFEIFLSGTI